MRKSALVSLSIPVVAALVWFAIPASSDDSKGSSGAAELRKRFERLRDMSPEERQAWIRERSTHLLDRGTARRPAAADKGGGPTGPIPIFYTMGSPGAVATTTGGTPMAPVGVFFPPGMTATGFMNGGMVGQLFPPAVPATPPVGYPMPWLTAGATPGFLVTGVYAWNWSRTPLLPPAAGGAATVVVGAAAITGTVGATMNAAAAVAATGAFTGLPNPSAVVGSPGNLLIPVPITAGAPNVFCGLFVGGPGFLLGSVPFWPGNGLGANAPPGLPGLPLRVGAGVWPFFTTLLAGVTVLPAVPANYIAGCYAAGATTPVELQSFHIE